MTQITSVPPVQNEEIFQDYCEELQLAESTIHHYKIHLQKYCDFVGKGLDELIEEAYDEQEDDVKPRKRKLTKYLKDYRKHLADYAPSSKRIFINSVKSFYSYHNIDLPINNRRRKSRKAREETKSQSVDVIPKMEEIQQILELCKRHYKVAVLLGISSGMGRSEIASLTFKHLYQAVSLEEPYPSDIPELVKILKQKGDFVPEWNIIRIKTGFEYFTFCSPECVVALIAYLEKLNYNFPHYKPKPEDSLLRTLSKNTPLNENQLGTTLSLINRRNGFRRHNGRYVCMPHGFRKFFASTLENNKMPHLTTRRLMGHNFEDTVNSYFRIDPETAKEDYLDVVNELSTNTVKVMKITTEGYEEVNAKIEEVMLKQVLYERQIEMLKREKG